MAILLGDGLAAEVFPYTDRDETLVLASLNIGTGRAKKTDLLPVVAQWLRSSAPQHARFADDLLIAPDSQIRVTRFAQVRAPRWHSRNVVLIGDSAHRFIDYADFSWGNYSFAPGGPNPAVGPKAWTTFGRFLREPVGHVHWAGTETAD